MRAKDSYNLPDGAQAYLAFLASAEGQQFQQVLGDAIMTQLSPNPEARVLDLACGPGWLTERLSGQFPHTEGADGSKPFLDIARAKLPQTTFTAVDIAATLPYESHTFDGVVFSMAAHDTENLEHTFAEIARILKPDGQLVMTIAHPHYAYPVGVWKRGILGRLLNRKPQLKVRPYFLQPKQYSYNGSLSCYFYPLSDYLNTAVAVGLQFAAMRELMSPVDSPRFDLTYRLHRFPTLLLLEFKKGAE
jgi:SAM-dependent methyltransferase